MPILSCVSLQSRKTVQKRTINNITIQDHGWRTLVNQRATKNERRFESVALMINFFGMAESLNTLIFENKLWNHS